MNKPVINHIYMDISLWKFLFKLEIHGKNVYRNWLVIHILIIYKEYLAHSNFILDLIQIGSETMSQHQK